MKNWLSPSCWVLGAVLSVFVGGCASEPSRPEGGDPYQYLDAVDGVGVQAWVGDHERQALEWLSSRPFFGKLSAEVRAPEKAGIDLGGLKPTPPSLRTDHDWIKGHRNPFPAGAQILGVFEGLLIALLNEPWLEPREPFPAGAVIAVPQSQVLGEKSRLSISTVFYPGETERVTAVSFSKNRVYAQVAGRFGQQIVGVTRAHGSWKSKKLPLPEAARVSVEKADASSAEIFIRCEGLLIPPTVYRYDGSSLRRVSASPAAFESKDLVLEQRESVSKDGTRIPYLIVHRNGLVPHSDQPAWISGGNSRVVPGYSEAVGKGWLEKGGVFAYALTRPAQESGLASLTGYDDFVSVAADLFRIHLTSPQHLGVMDLPGAPGSGLLTLDLLFGRPDLFRAVVSHVPAPSRFARRLAVKSEVRYPRPLIEPARGGGPLDRAAARRWVAQLEAKGHPALYLESADAEHRLAHELTYLWSELGAEPSK